MVSDSDPDVVAMVADQIADVVRTGAQVAVVGGGNFFRGAELQQRGLDRPARLHGHARHRHELPGVAGPPKSVASAPAQTAITMGQVAEPYLPLRPQRHPEKGRVVIFGAGMGTPHFSTDTTAAQRP